MWPNFNYSFFIFIFFSDFIDCLKNIIELQLYYVLRVAVPAKQSIIWNPISSRTRANGFHSRPITSSAGPVCQMRMETYFATFPSSDVARKSLHSWHHLTNSIIYRSEYYYILTIHFFFFLVLILYRNVLLFVWTPSTTTQLIFHRTLFFVLSSR